MKKEETLHLLKQGNYKIWWHIIETACLFRLYLLYQRKNSEYEIELMRTNTGIIMNKLFL